MHDPRLCSLTLCLVVAGGCDQVLHAAAPNEGPTMASHQVVTPSSTPHEASEISVTDQTKPNDLASPTTPPPSTTTSTTDGSGATSPTMSPPPTFELIVPRDATVQTVGALPCPAGTRQTGGAHAEHSAFSVDRRSTYCIRWPVPPGAMPVRHGPAVWFHDDGRIEQQGHYQDGDRHGLWEKRHANGRLEALVHYRDGQYDGPYFTWWDNGQPQSEIGWRAGKHHGISKTWDDAGNILVVKQYEDERVVATWIYDAQGNARRM
ncbi:MAG: hypothetical protein AAGF11_36215 [Myxococcota bacterium]